jgi:hypothetical protein
MFTTQQLHDEITLDPQGLGYQAHIASGDDTGLAVLLNSTYAGVGVVWRSAVPSRDVLASVVWSEVSSWSAAKVNWLVALLSPGTVDATQSRIRDIFVGVLGVGTVSLTNATAIAKVAGPTRAEELWGDGSLVMESQIAAALGRI